MSEKNFLELFIIDIEKIICGEMKIPSEYQHCDEEYKELLYLAQLLVKADYTTKSQDWMEKTMKKVISSIQKTGELEDDELDMVAGGVNLNEILDEYKKKV